MTSLATPEHGPSQPSAGVFLGVSLVGCGLLFLEVFSTRILAVSIGPYATYYTIAIAMLGVGAAGSVATAWRAIPTGVALRNLTATLSLAAAAGVILFLATATGVDAYQSTHPELSLRFKILSIGLALAVPYFLFGLTLAFLFRGAPQSSVRRLYAVDLIGAFVGTTLAVALMEVAGYDAPLAIAILLPVAASAALARGRKWVVTALACGLGISVALALPGIRGRLEPVPPLWRVARTNYMYDGYEAREISRRWTSFGRMAAIELTRPERSPLTVMSLGAGQGHARVLTYGDTEPPFPIRLLDAARMAVIGSPSRNVLVLLAGAGADMVLIDSLTEGRAKITGVELNAPIAEWPSSQSRFRLKEFFDQPNHRMVIGEAREFLARGKELYDSIVVSWSGVPPSFFTGMIGSSTSYIYTREGLEAMLDRLSPGGQITFLDTDMLVTMAGLAEILNKRGVLSSSPGFDNRFVLVGESDPPALSVDGVGSWKGAEGISFLLVKPDGYSEEDLERVRRAASLASNRLLLYDPGVAGTHIAYSALKAAHPTEFVEGLPERQHTLRRLATDDRPFHMDQVPPSAYLRPEFWSGTGAEAAPPGVSYQWQARRKHLIVLLRFFGVSLILILVPVLTIRRTGAGAPGAWNDFAYFSLLGAGFMWVEVALMQKLTLLVGHPGHAFGIILGSMVLFAGIGSLLSNRQFKRDSGNFRRVALLAGLSTIGVLLLYELAVDQLVALPRAFKILVAFLLPALPAFFMGHLYPQGLAALSKTAGRHIPICMAINSAAGTFAAGFAISMSQVVGIRWVILCGAACYLALAALPHSKRELALAEGRRAG